MPGNTALIDRKRRGFLGWRIFEIMLAKLLDRDRGEPVFNRLAFRDDRVNTLANASTKLIGRFAGLVRGKVAVVADLKSLDWRSTPAHPVLQQVDLAPRWCSLEAKALYVGVPQKSITCCGTSCINLSFGDFDPHPTLSPYSRQQSPSNHQQTN